jgi:hypothetical protein
MNISVPKQVADLIRSRTKIENQTFANETARAIIGAWVDSGKARVSTVKTRNGGKSVSRIIITMDGEP